MDEYTRTYCPPIPQKCPHTYGVRLCSCAAFATEPCRPTACIPAAPFRHTPYRFRPRRTATVWWNLQQHPRTHLSHTFSAKEKDTETGLTYFGARYYSSDLSIWLSVDPMSDKYASLSPYNYCANNPIKLVDPNGEEMYDGGDPLKHYSRFERFFDKKIKKPLMNMVENGASDDELKSAAATLSNKYQKHLRRTYQSENRTKWDGIYSIDIKVFSETEEIVKVESRPDNQEMTVCGEIPLEPDVYSAEVDFAPYGIENNATFTALNKVETGWVNSYDGDSFSYDLDVNGASSISYCIQNSLTDKRQDNWSFSVTLRSRRLDIRPVGKISDYRTHKKNVRTR